MANRSYLYSVDSVPDDDSIPDDIRCISEHKSSVPLAHKLLAGRRTFRCASTIWNGDLGIVGDFDGGVELLSRFLRVLGAGDVADRDRFDQTVASTEGFLAEPRRRGRYFLLECTEIMELYTDNAQAEVVKVVDDVASVVKLADAAIAGAETPWLTGLRTTWPQEFDSFYSDHLYYSFRRAES